MGPVGPLELMVILIVALLVVGPNRLPELGRSVGRGLREFRKAQNDVRSTLQTALAEEPETAKVNIPAGTPGGQADEVETSENGGATVPEPGPNPEPAAGSEAVEMARTLGRGLAELRRAREEIQRTFKVDLSDVTAAPAAAAPKATAPKATAPKATAPKATRPSAPEPAAAGEPPQQATDPTVPEDPAATE